MKSFLKIVFLSFIVYFLSWFVVFKLGINTLGIQSEDTLPAVFLPVSIIKNHSLYLDDYYDMVIKAYPHPDDKSYLKGLVPFYFRKVGGHYVSAFPVVTPLLVLPIYFLPVLLGMKITWLNLIFLSHISSSLIMAFAGGFIYLLLKKRFLLSETKSLLLIIVYLFGTVNFAMISQALWQHGTMQLFIILGLYFLFGYLDNGEKSKDIFLSGLFFGLAVLSRPTAALIWCSVFLILYFRKDKNFKKLLKPSMFMFLGLLLNFLFFAWYNEVFYVSICNQGYSSQLLNSWLSPFPEGFLGVWFSPSKGILVYSPVFLFAFVGLYLALKKNFKKNFHYLIFGLIILLHALVVGLWKHWYGGWSYGYRMSSDIIPFLVLLLVPFIESNLFRKYKKYFYGTLIFSILVQVFGIIFFDGIWHAAYDLGFEKTSWLWSIKDSELLFNIRRILVKVGLLYQACPKCLPMY
jgi:hypothetical protein